MDILYKSEEKVRKDFIQNYKLKSHIERQFILKFFDSLPIEDLKRLINFKEIDFENKNIWGDSREDSNLYNELCQLRNENVIKYSCELYLDNGINEQ